MSKRKTASENKPAKRAKRKPAVASASKPAKRKRAKPDVKPDAKPARKPYVSTLDGADKLYGVIAPISIARREIIAALENGPVDVQTLAEQLHRDFGISLGIIDKQIFDFWLNEKKCKRPPIKLIGRGKKTLSLVDDYRRPGFRKLPAVVKT